MKSWKKWSRLGTVAAVLWAGDLRAVTVAELQARLAANKKLTVIDVRSPSLFAQGHIPGAINVPASICAGKSLPPLGQVVVCGEGLGKDSAEQAAADLARKPGLTVAVLDGGFAGWESAHMLTTRGRGVQPEMIDYITYEQLKQARPAEMLLVDLRQGAAAAAKAKAQPGAASAPLTDLAAEFPGMPRVTSPIAPAPAQAKAASGAAPQPVLVLIDNGDGAAEAMARTLRGSGQKRVVVLAGGELALARKGRPGLQRSGGFAGSTFQTVTPPATSR